MNKRTRNSLITAGVCIALLGGFVISPLSTPVFSQAAEGMRDVGILKRAVAQVDSISDEVDDKTGDTDIYYSEKEISSAKAIDELIADGIVSKATAANTRSAYITNKITPVKEQGNEGVCWAFASIAAIETAYMTNYPSDAIPDFSEAAIAAGTFTEEKTSDGAPTKASSAGCDIPSSGETAFSTGASAAQAALTIAAGQSGLVSEKADPFITSGTSEAESTMTSKALTTYLQPQGTILKDFSSIEDYMMEAKDESETFILSRTFISDRFDEWKSKIEQYHGACVLSFNATAEYTALSSDAFWCYDADLGEKKTSDHCAQVYGYDNDISKYAFATVVQNASNIDATNTNVVWIADDAKNLFGSDKHENATNVEEYVATSITACKTQYTYKMYAVPKDNGGWIIKNSWGSTTKSPSGTYYVSYYDKTVRNLRCFDVEKVNAATQIQYDRIPSHLIHYETPVAGANVFTMEKDCTINEIGLTTGGDTGTVTVTVYRNLTDANNPESGTKVDVLTASSNRFQEYKSLSLNTPFTAKKGEKIGVVVSGKYSTMGSGFVAEIRDKDTKTYSYDGESFIKFSGESWNDTSTRTDSAVNANIAAKLIVTEPASTQSEAKTTYAVSYDANGGTGVMNALTVAENEQISAPESNFSRDGYSFTGWNTKADGTGNSYSIGTKITVKSDIKLYAQWKITSATQTNNENPNTQNTDEEKPTTTGTIQFNANGGTGTMEALTGALDTDVTLPECTFQKSGNKFVSWNTSKDGTGDTYFPGDTIKAADCVLYARWVLSTAATVAKAERTITYDANGGTGTMNNGEYTVPGGTLKIADNSFTRDGYTFICWNTAADGTGTFYESGSLSDTIEGTVYAQWAATNYAVITVANGSTVNLSLLDYSAESKPTIELEEEELAKVTINQQTGEMTFTGKKVGITKMTIRQQSYDSYSAMDTEYTLFISSNDLSYAKVAYTSGDEAKRGTLKTRISDIKAQLAVSAMTASTGNNETNENTANNKNKEVSSNTNETNDNSANTENGTVSNKNVQNENITSNIVDKASGQETQATLTQTADIGFMQLFTAICVMFIAGTICIIKRRYSK